MRILGKWLTRVDTPEGRELFKQLYDKDFYEMMIRHDVTHISHIFPDIIRHVVFVEYDGTFNQVFSLDDGDHLLVYSDGCMSDKGCHFNTDGIAFFCLVRGGEIIGWYSVENSPYDLCEDDWDLDDSCEELTVQLRAMLDVYDYPDTTKVVTNSNVLFVRQL